MIAAKDSVQPWVALRSSGDTAQSKGGIQKFMDVVHSFIIGAFNDTKLVRLPGIEPGSRAWKARVMAPRLQAQGLESEWSVEGWIIRQIVDSPFLMTTEMRFDLRILFKLIHGWSMEGFYPNP
jgi:hypothetical protein